MASDPDKLLKKHAGLTHSELQKVTSHVQREKDEWFVNTVMIQGHTVPFKFKRKKVYQSLTGTRVNLTYYPEVETVAGFKVEIMHVVRIKKS
jgi:hypothetical protein